MKKIIIFSIVMIFCVAGYSQQHHHHSKSSNTDLKEEVSFKKTAVLKSVINNYLALNKALINDDSKNASLAGNKLDSSLSNLDLSIYSSDEKEELKEIIESARMNAQHIDKSIKEIFHQREHLEFLTTDLKDLMEIMGADRELYMFYCPMFNDGVYWIYDSKEVLNPYYGKKMQKCGEMKQTIKTQ